MPLRQALSATAPTPLHDAARRSLTLAAEGIRALANQLDGTFDAVLDRLGAIAGRVVVTGMGKSGYIARKIAATLASTGTPALFVHPAEASHGDLGMITVADAVIALSNSGETHELAAIIHYSRRFHIPLIAISSVANSSLCEAADLALILPNVPEAPSMGLAPTTSTTMMLALGDAIAVALLERRGFTVQDFHLYHPGGALARKLKRVSDLMHSGDAMPLSALNSLMSEVLLTMTEKRFGCAGIVDVDGTLVGIVTDGDLRRHMSADFLKLPAAEVMTPTPLTIRPQALAAEALGLMNERAILALFVAETNRPLGIIHIHDCLQAGID